MISDPYGMSEYGAAPEGTESQCEDLCKGKTIKQLRKLADYFSNEASKLDKIANNDITMEQFQEMKKKSTQSIPTIDSEKEGGE